MKRISDQILEAQTIMLECGDLLKRQWEAMKKAQELLRGDDGKQKGES